MNQVNRRRIVENLRRAYDGKARERENTDIAPWKVEVRQDFLSLLLNERKRTLLEIGAGTGKDSKFFQDHGLHVTCIDLPPENVRLCQEKGLSARVMDVFQMEFPVDSFDSVYTMNCLLHVPKASLPSALRNVRGILKPGGLFYLGPFGGAEEEGVIANDSYDPPRFYSSHSDDEIKRVTSGFFKLVSFSGVEIGGEDPLRDYYQSIILRRSAAEP